MLKKQKNFCIAPFSQITFAPNGNYSPCPEIGGNPWQIQSGNPKDAWLAQTFADLRSNFTQDKKASICNRCWDNEQHGEQSLRRRLFSGVPYKKGLVNYINTEQYVSGPKQINLMVGNKCNLRCRICNPNCSVTFNVEGKYYQEKYKKSNYYNGKKLDFFSEEQIDQIFKLSKNVVRYEFYGGEPLIDLSTLVLLEKLVESKQSSDITLFYNTNATNEPTPEQLGLWKNFKSIELNLSLDDFGERFNYQRHPANWKDVLKFIDKLQQNTYDVNFSTRIICTVSIFNVLYLKEIFSEFAKFNMPIHLNLVQKPDYYSIYNMPFSLKSSIRKKLLDGPDKINFILSILDSTDITYRDTDTNTISVRKADNNKNYDGEYLDQFMFWTRAKDEYRHEDFSKTFPELYELMVNTARS